MYVCVCMYVYIYIYIYMYANTACLRARPSSSPSSCTPRPSGCCDPGRVILYYIIFYYVIYIYIYIIVYSTV